jgi:hypothetical protein
MPNSVAANMRQMIYGGVLVFYIPPMSKRLIPQNKNYANILRQIVAEIKHTQVIVANRVNTSMIQLYWNIGKHLSEEGLDKGYGGAVVKRLSVDLKAEFPSATGFSGRSLWDMKHFYEFYSEKLPQPVAVLSLPWIRKTLK